MKKIVAIAGNIGVGKSTLVEMLGEQMGWQPYFEPVAENPYLQEFYADMPTWAFHSQIYFLTQRLRSLRELHEHSSSVIQDRTVYEDAEIFAKNLYMRGQMNQRDYETYYELFELLTEMLPPPDLVIYLRASVPTLIQRIEQRGRGYESQITNDYLIQLNQLYDSWIANFSLCPILTIPADEMDYVAHSGHLALIVQKVKEKLTGKEEVVFAPEEVANSR